MWVIKDVSDNEYVGCLIELRDTKLIHEDYNGDAILNRVRYLTVSGYEYLEQLKKLYLKELLIKLLKWSLKQWYIALIAVLLGRCCS